MAFTELAVVSATVVDSWGTEASAPAYALVDPTQTVAEAIAEAQAYVKALDAVTDGRVTKMHMQFVPALPTGLKALAVATGAKVEQTGMLSFNSTGDTHKWSTAIPALSNSPTVVSGGKIVLTAGSPAQVLAALLAGGGTAALAWTNATSQAIASFASALISFRRYRRQVVEASYESVTG